MKKNALLMLCASLGGCADVGAQQPVNQYSYQGAPSYGAPQGPAASDSAVFELLGRLEQLQSEVRQLRGIVEEQGHTIADLERKQGNMYSDLDERIQLLTPTSQPASPGGAVAAHQAAQAEAPAEAAASQAQPEGGETAQQAAAENKPAEADASKVSEQERYQQAYETLRNGHNAQAIQMFEAIYADNPNGEFGDNAQYWLGEAYKINREFDKARAAFNKVVSQYPESSKVPDALLKLGYIELEQQNPAKARDYFTRITTSYPGTTAAHLAAKKLAIMTQ